MYGARDWDASCSANFKSDVFRKYFIEWMQNEDLVDMEGIPTKNSSEDNW